MAANSQIWKFEQLGGEGRTLELAGHAAPFGAPRRGSVVDEEYTLRDDEVYYDGPGVPTRHIFGERAEPITIHGIWMDRRGGFVGFAKAKKREVLTFFRDKQPVRVTWDDIIGIVGLIKRVRFGNESGAHITWEMEILVDEDLLSPQEQAVIAETRGPASFANQIQLAMLDSEELLEPLFKGDIFDSLDSLIGSVNSIAAELRETSEQIDSFANAPFAELRRLRAGLGQFRTAVVNLRRTYDELLANVSIEVNNTTEWQHLWNVQAALSSSTLTALRFAAQAEREAAKAEQGRVKAFYTAREGESWEAISQAVYGDSLHAAEVRQANGVDGGAAPTPGTTYLCPRTSTVTR